MNDLISRQMLLEYIHGEPVGRLLCDKYNLDGLIKQFPSARPEKRTEERTETHACDLISRQAAIDAVSDCGICIQRIVDLPYAQPEQRWIPCSERLPDRFGKMLVTFIPGTLWTYVIIANYSDLMGIAKPCFWIGNVGKNDFANITSQVVAWMPLPEPYNEDDK